MQESLAEFERLGDDRAATVVRGRLGANALMADDPALARQLLEDVLATCRTIPNPKLEADVIGKLAWVERRQGNLERALELFEESATRCEQVGYTWMQAQAEADVAELCHELGRTETAEERGREALRLAQQLHDRQMTVFVLAVLAGFASAAGNGARAGRLWGAVEGEEARRPVGQWENERGPYEQAVLPAAGHEFEAARASGRTLSLDEAVAYALSVDSPS